MNPADFQPFADLIPEDQQPFHKVLHAYLNTLVISSNSGEMWVVTQDVISEPVRLPMLINIPGTWNMFDVVVKEEKRLHSSLLPPVTPSQTSLILLLTRLQEKSP